MALIPSSFLQSAPVSLPLFKLSFCTTPTVRANLFWTHLPQRDNLFAVFDSVSQKDVEGYTTQKKILKLVRGGDLLEHIELDTLALQARLDEERNKSQLLEDADRYVILLVKRPLLAMRYQLPNGQIRRIQLNFRPESGYDTALNALYSLGLPIREKAQPTAQPVPAASYSQSYQHNIPQPQPSRLLPSPDFTYRPSTSNGFEYRPSSSAPDTPSERPWTAPDPVSFSQTLPPKRELPVAMQAHRAGSAPKKPCPGPWSLDQNALPRREALTNPRPQATSMPPFNLVSSTTASPSFSLVAQSVSDQMLPPAPQNHLSRQTEVTSRQARSQLSTEIAETSTPSNYSGRSAALKRPPAKQKPKPKPKATKTTSSTQSKESKLIVKAKEESKKEMIHSASGLPQRTQVLRSQARVGTPEILSKESNQPLLTSDNSPVTKFGDSQALNTQPGFGFANIVSGLESGVTALDSATHSFSVPSTAVEPSAESRETKGVIVLRPGRQALAELARNSVQSRHATDVPPTTSTEAASKYPLLVGASEISPEEFMSQLSHFVHDFQNLPAPNPGTATSANLAAYAAQPDSVRQGIVKDMIYEFLGDENFIKLAEDVSQEWTRIGLGF